MTGGAGSSAHSIQPIMVIGAGKMGSAMVDGWLARGYRAGEITLVDPIFAQGGGTWIDKGVDVCVSVESAGIKKPSIILLAVKPQIMATALASVKALDRDNLVVVSIAAGVRSSTLRAALPRSTVVRAMPNTPSAVGEGITACFASSASSAERERVAALMQAVGSVVWVDAEALMDAVTALSGSGPAYVFHLVEAMASAGEKLGLPANTAMTLARQTVVGAGALLSASDEDAATLRENVTSPGGTTQAGLQVLRDSGALADLLAATVQAAADRSAELASSE